MVWLNYASSRLFSSAYDRQMANNNYMIKQCTTLIFQVPSRHRQCLGVQGYFDYIKSSMQGLFWEYKAILTISNLVCRDCFGSTRLF